MKKLINSIFILFTIGVFAQNIEIPVDSLNFNSIDVNTTMYIKRINYFEYKKADFIIDSVKVDEKRIIRFNKKNNDPEFYLISKDKKIPITYVPLRQHPDKFYSLFCGNFYINFSYLFISKKYNHKETKYLKNFYKKSIENSFDKELYEGSYYKKITIKEAEKLVSIKRDLFMKNLNDNKNDFSNEFYKYIQTEINLGATNQFLNWYEHIFIGEIQNTFNNNQTDKVLEKHYQLYKSNDWDENSVQFFRTTERYINFKLSNKTNVFKLYHQASEEKKQIAKKYLSKKTYNRYVN